MSETNPEVDRLRADVGTWDVTLAIRPEPDADPVTITGVATNRMVGNWLVADISTESGFAGHGVYGWDEASGSYVAAWVDTAAPGMAHGEGTWDDEAATMTYVMGVQVRRDTVVYHETFHREDDDTRDYRNVMTSPDGVEYVAIHATHRRRS